MKNQEKTFVLHEIKATQILVLKGLVENYHLMAFVQWLFVCKTTCQLHKVNNAKINDLFYYYL